MSLYTGGDKEGSVIVDAGVSHIRGKPLDGVGDGVRAGEEVDVEVVVEGTGVSVRRSVEVGSMGNEIGFGFPVEMELGFEAYNVTVTVCGKGSGNGYTASAPMYRMPERTDGGSITKLDSLYGGLWVQDYIHGSGEWSPILPYSFFVSWDGWLEKSLDNVRKFKGQGYNIMHIVPNAGLPNEAFNFTELNMFLDKCDELGLWLMYDMRWTYQNLSSVEEQVRLLKSRRSMLLWYTADEPDGHGDPLTAPKDAYDLIKSMDPWHPVSLCLNCFDFYYEEYSSGADIILSDVYPVAVNTQWSEVYHTVCNTTYGCCGCDDCEGNFEDISHRLDRYAEYQTWLGDGFKAFWGVPQAFGNESYWRRAPTVNEEVVMNILSLNHNAKGIVMWTYPTNQWLMDVASDLSKVLVTPEVTWFLLEAPTVPLKVDAERIDAAGWRIGNRMLISIVYMKYQDLQSQVTVTLPPGACSINRVLWGSSGWEVSEGQLVKDNLTGLETDLLVVEFE